MHTSDAVSMARQLLGFNDTSNGLRMYRNARAGTAHSLRRGVGVFCLGLGSVGLLLPLVPGIPFLIAGGLLLRPRRRHDTRDIRGADAVRDGARPDRLAPVDRLSAAERVQLGFWKACRAVTTQLDRRS
jgi:hypothetical protein